MTAEKAAIAKAHEDAKEHGLVEKTAGESPVGRSSSLLASRLG